MTRTARSHRAGLRRALWVLIALLAIAEVQALALALQSQEHARERWVADQRHRLPALRQHLMTAFRREGGEAVLAEVRRVLAPTVGAALLDAQGHVLARQMDVGVTAEIGLPPRRAQLQAGGVVTVGPSSGPAPRVVTYVQLTHAGAVVYLGVARAADELARDLAERRTELLVRGLCLVLVILVALAAALAVRPEANELAGAGAMNAYEEAMARLRQSGDEASRVHAEELRHLRETVRDREAMARAGELTAGIVHEVRNGLGAIMGYARLIEGAAGPESESGKMARGLIDEAHTLEAVIQRIVEFVRNEELRPSALDLKRLLERVVARETRSRAGAETRVEIAEPLPMVGDEDLLERALENLVRNARDAAGPEGTVVVEAHREGDSVVALVSDDGAGLAPELADGPKAFVTTKRGGLGLGLPTALKILALHEGRLALRPRRPKGLVAEVILPCSAPAEALPSVAARQGREPSAQDED